MAVAVVGGAFLSASLQALFTEIRSIVNFVTHKLDEELLEQLKNKLLLANGVLDGAERLQITKTDVREWLERLKHAIQNTEDLVDGVKTEALRCQLEADRKMLFRARNFFPSRFFVKDVERRIQNIIKSVDDIVKDMNRLGLREGTSIPFPIQRAPLAEESDVYGRDAEKEVIIKFLLSDGGHKISVMPIVGMGGLGKTTLALLVYNMIDANEKVMEKPLVMEKPFDIKAWITVSDESKYDVFTLTKAICEKVPELQLDNTIRETSQLQRQLKEALRGTKFLFVLDDVWNMDFQTWNELQIPFRSAADGSKIIVTTRLPTIAKDLGTAGSEALDLALLSEDDGWKLFSKHAIGNMEPSSYAHLEEIGKKIVGKCKGNPLAVKSLGCLLHSQLEPKEWEKVLVNYIWELEQGEDGSLPQSRILPALWLSYYYLPPHLKQCFAYCSIFPKDYLIEKEELILLWMAENLLQPEKNMMLEEVGEKYFEQLTSRSFFIVDKYGRGFTMHDLVNDLAKFVSGESCLRLDGNCSGNLTSKTRRISCMAGETSDISKKMEDLSKNKVLRTLLVLMDESFREKQYNINPKELRSMQYLRVLSASPIFFTFEGRTKLLKSIGSLKRLRYLDLSHNKGIKKIPDIICKLYNFQTLLLRSCSNLAKLPDSIGNLKHLRHLNLSETAIEKMPDTICNLHELRHLNLSETAIEKMPDTICNLHELRHLNLSKTAIEKMPDTICNLHELRTLSLADCEKLTELPTNISMLTNLCKLDTRGTSLKEMPISNLKNLQNLPEFVVGKRSGIEELGNLTNLRDDLRIRSLENVEEVEDVSKAILKNKKYITKLSLDWNDDSSDVSHNKAREVLDRLQPHTNLAELSVINYGGRSFPDWMGHYSFCSIKEVILKGCKNCDRLPPLGELPSLEWLQIHGLDKVERIGDEFYLNDSSSSSPPFKSLKKLKIRWMGEWKEWSSVGGAFPNLKQLYLIGCGKLKGACLPDINLPSLEDLRIWDNHHVVASLSRCQFPSLRVLRISGCGGMKSFPQGRLPSTIRSIHIEGCHDLESLSEEGWPCSNLKSLQIKGCRKLFAHGNKWNLRTLTSLTSLVIQHVDMEGVDSFPEEEGQLPTTLTSLHLIDVGNIKSLNGRALRHLTSLQSLRIWNCQELQCLPEETLPASLSELSISECPMLKPRCQRGIGQDRDTIHHIPNIWIEEEGI